VCAGILDRPLVCVCLSVSVCVCVCALSLHMHPRRVPALASSHVRIPSFHPAHRRNGSERERRPERPAAFWGRLRVCFPFAGLCAAACVVCTSAVIERPLSCAHRRQGTVSIASGRASQLIIVIKQASDILHMIKAEMAGMTYQFQAAGVSSSASHLMFTDRFMACFVPKGGSSTWLAYMEQEMLLYPPRTIHSRFRTSLHGPVFWGGDNYTALAEAAVSTPFRFMVVRHPWKRLLSFYHQKWKSQKNDSGIFYKELGVTKAWADAAGFHGLAMLLQHKLGSGGMLPPTVQDTSVLGPSSPTFGNKHYRPQYLLCQHHHIKYHKLIDLDNMADHDLILIQEKCGFKHRYNLSKTAMSPTLLEPCNMSTVAAVERVYGLDAVLGGFNFLEQYESCGKLGLSNFPSYVPA